MTQSIEPPRMFEDRRLARRGRFGERRHVFADAQASSKSGKIHGVNLGGWLVLEIWIKPSLFEGQSAEDEYTLCQSLGMDKAITLLKKHQETWITADDFKWLAAHGLNAVRLPVGYWVVEENPPGITPNQELGAHRTGASTGWRDSQRRGRTGKRTCKHMEREENHEKGSRWSRASIQIGNVTENMKRALFGVLCGLGLLSNAYGQAIINLDVGKAWRSGLADKSFERAKNLEESLAAEWHHWNVMANIAEVKLPPRGECFDPSHRHGRQYESGLS